ncbi:MAG: glycosyltransferase family 2 protein [Verrucomicrobiota bacterium]|nr:glycosyltransferase family 2 protein [Verrucomicrobiota bacterium]
MNADLTVVVPVFNGAKFLAPLLQQLRAGEVIVVDDGSTDETPAIAREFEVTYLHQAQRGPAAARNAGLRRASTEFVAFLDVDDEWNPPHPADALALLQRSSWDVIVGQTRCLTNNSATLTEPFHTFNLGSALFRRDVFARVGDFDEALAFGEDLDWFLRARERGVRMALIEATTLHYRLHEQNLIGRAGAAKNGMLHALHLSIARRRESHAALADLPRIA